MAIDFEREQSAFDVAFANWKDKLIGLPKENKKKTKKKRNWLKHTRLTVSLIDKWLLNILEP